MFMFCSHMSIALLGCRHASPEYTSATTFHIHSVLTRTSGPHRSASRHYRWGSWGWFLPVYIENGSI